MLRRPKFLIIVSVVLVLEVLFVLYFFFVKNGRLGTFNAPSDHKITVVSNDPNVTLNFDPNNQDFNDFVNELGLFDENGVIDVNTEGMQTKGTIKDLEIVLEENEQPTIRDRGANGETFVSYKIDYSIDKKMTIHIFVNYNLNKQYLNNDDLKESTKNVINNTIIYLSARFSSKYGIPGDLNQIDTLTNNYFDSGSEIVVTIKDFTVD